MSGYRVFMSASTLASDVRTGPGEGLDRPKGDPRAMGFAGVRHTEIQRLCAPPDSATLSLRDQVAGFLIAICGRSMQIEPFCECPSKLDRSLKPFAPPAKGSGQAKWVGPQPRALS